ncbi:MCE family protein [Mycobacterium intracellulare]|nr:MCE family protein [Mycobacterium intracellulare]MEE3753130.1 MCE family protein [Mycobacterium intracellulare]
MLLAGCASGLESLPLPAPGQTGTGISLTAAFSNALNLPTQAKVKLNGADIGEVESIRAQNFTAYVKMRIKADVQLHVGATAELRSATPLGDVFVAIRPDPNVAPGALLRDGDTIALGSTSAAASIEQVLSSAALLVNGGAVRRLVTIVNGTGSAVGGRGEKVAELLRQSNTLISRLNARSAQIDHALRSTNDLAATLSARQDTLREAITAAAPATGVLADNTAALADTVDTIARITRQLNRFPSLRGTDTRSLIADLNRLSAKFNDISLDPTVSLRELNMLLGPFMQFTHSTAVNVVAIIPKIAIGALPDKNYPGDPEFHLPDGTDYHAMIGSLRYEWNLFLSKIYGPEHRPR